MAPLAATSEAPPGGLLAIMDRLTGQMRAVGPGGCVVKDDRHYCGLLQGLSAEQMAAVREVCQQHGYRAEFAPGELSGRTLTLTRRTELEDDANARGNASRAVVSNPAIAGLQQGEGGPHRPGPDRTLFEHRPAVAASDQA